LTLVRALEDRAPVKQQSATIRARSRGGARIIIMLEEEGGGGVANRKWWWRERGVVFSRSIVVISFHSA
jgi:hypothetical protein